MLVLSTLFIFVSLSVAAIPLGPRGNDQTPHIRRISSLPVPALPNLPLLDTLPLPRLPLPLPKPNSISGRFIMGADYASNSGPSPFLGKSAHKRQDPLSGVLGSATTTLPPANDLFPPNLSSGSTPT
ncbi:hypothetical protein F5888DRAFT_1669376 [Russula emetica]|nr:hypothetical protein F5888DRAFT_1669376 [Russula emetica]